MAASPLVFRPAHELAALVRSRQVSPLEVVTAFLDRIEALDPAINSFITVTRAEALQRARAAEKEIAAGRYRGELHGIPYAVKDLLATKGIRTTNGSRLTADWVPDYESTITERLNRAGAILIGKLNCLEFAMGSGVLSHFGPTRNPWALDHSPSGSSSGSGAAVAASLTPLAIGTDTGGSIRSPANACGIVGLKQTYGRVSRFGVTTLSWTCDHAGPMTRTVRDAAAMLSLIAGPDSKDESTGYQPLVPDYSRAFHSDLRGLRVGVPSNYFFDDAKPESKAAVHAAIAKLEDLGARVLEVSVPHAELGSRAIWIIEMAEAACFHEKRIKEHPDWFEPLVRERLEVAKLFPATDYIKAMRVRTMLTAEMRGVFQKCDVMAVPAGNPAVLLETREAVSSDVSRPPRKEPWTIGNMTGYPALVVPCGFTVGPPVLPVGIQFYAKPFDESTLFRVGHAYETAAGWQQRRAPEPPRGKA